MLVRNSSVEKPEFDVDVDVDVLEYTSVALDEPWHVVLFNDEVHTFDEVVGQVIKATGCSAQEATQVTLDAHNTGSAGAYTGEFEACFGVQRILQEIALQTEIRG